MAAIATQTIELDLTPGNISPFLYVSQGDYGTRSLVFNLYQNNQPYTIPSTVTSVTLDGITVAGNVFSVQASFTQGSTQVTGSLTSDMTDTIGMDICQLTFHTSGGVLGTANFYICVEKTPTMTMVKYSNMYYADLAKSWAVGDTGLRAGENTNNSKYWSTVHNADIASLKTRATDLEGRATSLEIRTTSLETKTSSVDTRTSRLEGRTTSLEGRATSLENRSTVLEVKVGDLDDRMDKVEDFKPWTEERLHFSVELKTINLVDRYGAYLTDNNGNKLIGSIYLPVTDTTGELEGYPIDSSVVGKTYLMQYKDMGLPIMYLDHEDIESLRSKEDGDISNVAIRFPYRGIDTTLKKLKVQGASSQGYPKKNYTITFNSDVILNDDWGLHKKYVIKADWVDFSQMRNEICAKLWGQIRKSRVNGSNALVNNNGDYLINSRGDHLVGVNDPAFSMGMNYGAVDGYPICVVINGKYWGLYSLMIPKDDWMAGMKGEYEYEAIVSAEDHSLPTKFRSLITSQDENGDMYGDRGDGTTMVVFSNEYISNENDMSWLQTSLNNLISSAMATYSSDEVCKNSISQYVDIDSAIDYYIFNCVVNNVDGTDKNFLLDTWDGVKWYFAAYDMDSTFGFHFSGKINQKNTFLSFNPTSGCTFNDFKNRNQLMWQLFMHVKSDIKSRYQYLRTNVLTEAKFAELIWNYAVDIPKAAYDYEVLRWPTRPGTNTNNVNQILDYFRLRCQALDAEIETF